jgi:competence protein ComEC
VRLAVAFPAGGLVLGCAAGLWWPDVPSWVVALLLVASSAGAGCACITGRRAALAACLATSFAAGGALLAVHRWEEAWRPSLKIAFESIAREERVEAERAGRWGPMDDNAAVAIVGVLRSDAAPTGAGNVSLNLEAQWVGRLRSHGARGDPAANPVTGGVLLTVVGLLAAERQGEWRAGRTLRVAAQVHRPAVYLDPGVPDQERVLARRGIALVGTVKSGALVDVESRAGPVAESAAAIRAFARRAIADSVGCWSSRAAAIVAAIVIGDRGDLDADVERRLQEAGTYHVIAISGGNIAILAGLTLAAFRVAGLLGRAAMVAAIAGLAAYGYLVGGGASVDRATLMAVVYFGARALDLRASPRHGLVVVGGLLLAADPLSAVDPAFLLTFGATAAILVVGAEIDLEGLPRLAAPAAAMLLASAAAEAALLPVGATLFSRVTFAGLVLNFAAIPLMAVAQIAGMLVVPLALISRGAAAIAGWCAYAGAEGLVRSAGLVAYVPFVTWRVAPPAFWASGAYYVGAASAWVLWRRRVGWAGSNESAGARTIRYAAGIVAAGAGLWIVAEPWTILQARGDGRLHVTFIDVGQGDAAFVRFPRGSTLLVDTGGLPGGGSFDIGDRIVSPVLRAAGVRRLDTLALTHGDADHVGGAPAIVREFRPWEVWEGVPVPASPLLQTIHATAAAAGTRSRYLQTGDVGYVDDVAVVVRHPLVPDWERQASRNDDSVVLELLWKRASIVLTGDIGADVESAIAPRFRPVPLRVLKVAHHGSLSSSSRTFIDALAPRVAVVSVGRSNHFGHPAPAVIGRLEGSHAQLFRTDRDGAVTVETDGASLVVSTFRGRRFNIEETSRDSRE